MSLVNIYEYEAWLILMNGRQRNATNSQIWGKKNESNYDGNCTPRHCLSGTYEISGRLTLVEQSVQYCPRHGSSPCFVLPSWLDITNNHGRRPALFTQGRFTLYVMFPFRRGTSPFSKLFSCVIKRRCSHWQERLRHVSVPFRRWARMFDVTERVRTGLHLLESDNVNSNYVTSTTRRVFAYKEGFLS